MIKSKIILILTVVGCFLIIVGVALAAWAFAVADDPNAIVIKLNDGSSQAVSFKDLSLTPGNKTEYKFILDCKGASDVSLKLDFIETEESGLKKFARVKILENGSEIYDALLADAFDEKELSFFPSLKDGDRSELDIIYYLPLSVGNEAKNTSAVFDLLITAGNK